MPPGRLMRRFGWKESEIACITHANEQAATDAAVGLLSGLARSVASIPSGLAFGFQRRGAELGLGSGDLFRGPLRSQFSSDTSRLGLLRRAAFGGAGIPCVGNRLQRGLLFDPGGVTGTGAGAKPLQQGLFGGSGGTQPVIEIGSRVGRLGRGGAFQV